MPNTYVIGPTIIPTNPSGEALVNMSGTVNGVPVAATCWFSEYISHAASVISAQNFVISKLLAAYNLTLTNAPQNAPPPNTVVVQ